MSYTEYYSYRNRNYYNLGSNCVCATPALTSNQKFLPPLAPIYTKNYQKIANKDYIDVVNNESKVDEDMINKFLNDKVYYRNIFSDLIDEKIKDYNTNGYISNTGNPYYNTNDNTNDNNYTQRCSTCGNS